MPTGVYQRKTKVKKGPKVQSRKSLADKAAAHLKRRFVSPPKEQGGFVRPSAQSIAPAGGEDGAGKAYLQKRVVAEALWSVLQQQVDKLSLRLPTPVQLANIQKRTADILEVFPTHKEY